MSFSAKRSHYGLRRAGLVLLWATLLLAVAMLINVLGIRMAGSIENWQQWLAVHASHFLAWRLLLYAGTVWGWIWMRRRVLAREPEASTRQRLRRAELLAIVAVSALEISQFVQAG